MPDPCLMCSKKLKENGHRIVVHIGDQMPGLVAGTFCSAKYLIEGMAMMGRVAAVSGALPITDDTDESNRGDTCQT